MKHLKLFILVLLLFLPQSLHAKIFRVHNYQSRGPITVRPQNPLYLQLLADPMAKAETLSKRSWNFSLETTFSNVFERDTKQNGVGLDLDMEIWRTAFNFQYGLTKRNEIGIQIPLLTLQTGFLDQFIQDYHSAFGFPNAGRERVTHGRFSYRVTQNGNNLYTVNQQGLGLSDIVLWNKFMVFDEKKILPALAVKTSLKLPTGRPVDGTGSGSVDFAFSLLAQKSYKKLTSYTQTGFVLLGNHDHLESIQKNGAFHFGQALEFNLFEHLSLITQISGNTSYFKNVTNTPDLSKMILDLTVGFNGEIILRHPHKKLKLQVAFSEDPLGSGPSVDFSVYFKVGVDSSFLRKCSKRCQE